MSLVATEPHDLGAARPWTGDHHLTPRAGRRLWRRWVAANAVGELLGLGLTGALAGLAIVFLEPRAPILSTVAVIASGGVEGAIVGVAQWRVLRDALPVRARPWIVATMAGALAAWTAGVTPSVLLAGGGAEGAAMAEPSLAVQLLLAAALGLVAGPILGGPQAVVLRGHVPHPWRWVAANAAAWACALPLTFVAPSLVPPAWPSWVLVPTFAAGALIAGAVAGAVHGAVLVGLAGGRAMELVNPIMHRLLRGPAARWIGGLALLEFAGRRSGAPVTVVTGYAVDGDRYVILAADAERKRWWRNFPVGGPADPATDRRHRRTDLRPPHPVTLHVGGVTLTGTGRRAVGRDADEALARYRAHHPRVPTPSSTEVRDGAVAIVVIDTAPRPDSAEVVEHGATAG